jgi:hypothetical protein
MSIFDDLPDTTPQLSRIWRGKFATTPTTITELVDVILPDASMDYRWKNCYWEPRYKIEQVNVAESAYTDELVEPVHNIPIPQILFPKRDDLCLCVFDNWRQIWVVMWWPF